MHSAFSGIEGRMSSYLLFMALNFFNFKMENFEKKYKKKLEFLFRNKDFRDYFLKIHGRYDNFTWAVEEII